MNFKFSACHRLQSVTKAIVTVLCLVSTSVVTIATSKQDYHPPPQSNSNPPVSQSNLNLTFAAASNCPQSLRQAIIVVDDNGNIVSPAQNTFLDFGLPQATLVVGTNQQVNGVLANGVSRTCIYSVFPRNGNPLHIYSCYDYNQPVCQISFEPTVAQ